MTSYSPEPMGITRHWASSIGGPICYTSCFEFLRDLPSALISASEMQAQLDSDHVIDLDNAEHFSFLIFA